ncbi:hypothetical protein GWI33_015343 [Rhynchophorus ferrugineus]|uniref:CWF19-like protein 1 n=1 Tax=Rhynchophorus ferrugineus TaxID=354439 RepID=A0A834I3L0_RHYFE|nr:hypothetical protein GWI33_015343 [Rhynchophorus ferrugineus]
MSNKVKILLCGDVEGKFDALFKRVDTINNKSGPFDLLLCVGNFFGINNKEFIPYKIGDKKIPIPTYILGPNKEDHVNLYPNHDEHHELCTNVFYLGKRGIFTDSKGLKIAYISGVTCETQDQLWTYNQTDISTLCDIVLKGNPSFKGVDILLTSQWPLGIIEKKANITVTQQNEMISLLCVKLKPRYIISGLEGMHYERAPFRCPSLTDHDMEIATRFIALARVGNPKKDKWLYALNLTPMDKMKISDLLQKTTDETPCPLNLSELESKVFKTKKKRHAPNGQQYFYDMEAPMEDNQKKSKPKRQKVEFDQNKCWFCLASPTFEKHLVVSVGDHSYLALAKGGLVKEHFLISPMTHFQSSLACTDDIQKEMEKFKNALHKYFSKDGKVPVFFERNYKTSHMQLQVVPIPQQATRELKDIFMDESDAQGFQLSSLEPSSRLDQVIPPKTPFFTVELPDNTILYTTVVSSMNFPLNFAREVLASGPILNKPDRIDYRDCIVEKDQEDDLVKQIRIDFEPFDFTTNVDGLKVVYFLFIKVKQSEFLKYIRGSGADNSPWKKLPRKQLNKTCRKKDNLLSTICRGLHI